MMGHHLAARNLFASSPFSGQLLVWYLVCGLLAILFLFYFNRFVGKVISFAIRAYTWHYYRVYVDIQSLQFSLLAGRVFFKGIRYHGQNETILIQDGFATWRYWLRHAKGLTFYGKDGRGPDRSDEYDSSEESHGGRSSPNSENAGRAKQVTSPCRILLECRGAQWFVYNRSPAYDAILHSVFEEEFVHTGEPWREAEEQGKDFESLPKGHEHAVLQEEKQESTSDTFPSSQEIDRAFSPIAAATTNSTDVNPRGDDPKPVGLLNLLPIEIECSKAAMVLGNRNTRSVLTATIEKATGIITASSCNRADQYKQLIDFHLVHPVVQLKPNREYENAQDASTLSENQSRPPHSLAPPNAAEDAFHRGLYHSVGLHWELWRAWISRRRIWRKLFGYKPTQPARDVTSSTAAEIGVYGQDRWLGLMRYLDQDDDGNLVEQEKWKAIEYARFPVLLDCPELAINFYWDVPGIVSAAPSEHRESKASIWDENINGCKPPDWGIHLRVKGGMINYGPWADRQRGDLQATFFPTLYKDSQPAKKLLPGHSRVSTEMKVLVDIEESTTLRIPFREESKDWRWKGHAASFDHTDAKRKKRKPHGKGNTAQITEQGPKIRPFGWLDVTVSPNSTINFNMDLAARTDGFRNHLNMDLRGLEISSSVNHGLLLKSQSQTISCDLGYPRQWNALRHWKIQLKDTGTDIFLLREHIFLLTDLINDWSTGPLPDFYTFLPFKYSISASFKLFRLYVNINDNNIIDNPADVNSNSYVVIGGQVMMADVEIPAVNFRPNSNEIAFNVKLLEATLDLLTPPWNPQSTFLSRQDVASLKELAIQGSYHYFTTTSPALTDTLFMDISGVSPKAHLYGFLVRYLMKIKDNYFGDDIHFRTSEEYKNHSQKAQSQPHVPSAPEQGNRVSNDMDVILVIKAQSCCAQLPCNLYSASESIDLESHLICADLRVTNYYMDLAVTSSPITASRSSRTEVLAAGETSVQLFLDGFVVTGHRLFGLPPTEPTYVCNWDFEIGEIRGEASVSFLQALVHAIGCFGFSFDDAENALPPINALIVNDMTFLRANIQPIAIGIQVDEAAFILKSGIITVNYNDWAGERFSDRLSAMLPNIQLSLLSTRNPTTDSATKNSRAVTLALLKTAIGFGNVTQKKAFPQQRQLQQKHIMLHDLRTGRTPWLLQKDTSSHGYLPPNLAAKIRSPAMCYPVMPAPITLEYPSDRQTLSNYSEASSPIFPPVSLSARRSRSFLASVEPRARRNSTKKVKKRSSSPNMQSNSGESLVGFSFTSPYKRPHFPLLSIKEDPQHLPRLPKILLSDQVGDEDYTGKFDQQDIINTEQDSLMINFYHGLQIFCTPECLFVLTDFQKSLQTQSPEGMLDSLQIESLVDVLHAEETNAGTSRILNFRLFCPFLGARFLNTAESRPEISSSQECYEFKLHRFVANVRKSDLASSSTRSVSSQQLSLSCSVDRLQCSASESIRNQNAEQAVIELVIQKPAFWFFYDGAISAGAQAKDIELISASRKVDYISSLIRQTLLLSETLAERFTRNAKETSKKLELLVLLLSEQSDKIPDPPFLNATSYMLRGDLKHLRSSDSWKMMSRLRYVLQELTETEREKLERRCVDAVNSCPEDSHAKIVKTFEKWRAWDLVGTKPSILLGKILSNSSTSSTQVAARTPARINLQFESIRIVVDPGLHQNEIILRTSIIGLTLFHDAAESTDVSIGSSNTFVSIVEAYFTEIGLHLNWSLCELLENVLQTVLLHPPWSNETVPEISKLSLREVNKWHFIVTADAGILNADTLSIKARSICKGLHVSLLLVNDEIEPRNCLTSISLNSESASSEIRSTSKPLTLYNLRSFSFVGSQVGKSDRLDTSPPVWRVVGSGKEISFQVLATIQEIMDAANSVIQNEVAYIVSWIESVNSILPKSGSPKSTRRVQQSKSHVTLFLDAYVVSIAILPALVYRIYGTGGKVAIKYGILHPSSGHLDIDVKEHAHVFTTGTDEDADELSALQIPPINGSLTFNLEQELTRFTTRILVEPILFEASAIHALVDAVNQPEIVDLGKVISQQTSMMQQHVDQIFKNPNKKLRTSSSSRQILLYNAYVTLAGLAIHASALDTNSGDYSAELDLDMGRIQMKAANNDGSAAIPLQYPILEMDLDDIRIRLLRSNEIHSVPCGEFGVGFSLRSSPETNDLGKLVPSYRIRVVNPIVAIYSNTASAIVTIAHHLQDTLKTIKVSEEVKHLGRRGYSRLVHETRTKSESVSSEPEDDPISAALLNGMYSLEITNICLAWKVQDSIPTSAGRNREDLTLSFTKIELSTKKGSAARLAIQDFQLQMVPPSQAFTGRSPNSALLPEVVFTVAYMSTVEGRRLAFQAKGKSLDMCLTSSFLLPASDLRRSIAEGVQQVRNATFGAEGTSRSKGPTERSLFGRRKLTSLFISADFAGAVVHIQGRSVSDPHTAALRVLRGVRAPQHGRYNQFTPDDANASTTLRSPGMALKIEYKNESPSTESLSAEVRVDASTNVLYPTVVPIILEISSSVKEIVGELASPVDGSDTRRKSTVAQAKFLEDDILRNGDPLAIFGNCSLNFGLQICAQEFSLSCQPIARVAATARFENTYITVNTVRSGQHGKFFSISAAFSGLGASIQHVYSRESTGGITIDTVVLSLMNSRHVSDKNGISAILNISPMNVHMNAKQSQDFLLFREIWLPPEIRHNKPVSHPSPVVEQQTLIVQKYQQVATNEAFPWNATVSIAEVNIKLDMGQSLGRSNFVISKLWTSSKKTSDSEQNLCLGFDQIGIESSGRMTGLIELRKLRMRTLIKWPTAGDVQNQTPLVQASIAFDHLEVRAGFDYQAFFVAQISSLDFIMYNTKSHKQANGDRLMGILDGDQIQAFCTTCSASQALALYQAFQRLIQEKQVAYEASLRDLEKFLRRKSTISPLAIREGAAIQKENEQSAWFSALKIQTNVAVNLRSISIGAFPATFFDRQVLKVEAIGASARFSVLLEGDRIHSTLGLVLGELRIALAGIARPNGSKTLGDTSVADVISAVGNSQGGTILKVPRLVAQMQTWQTSESTQIDYVFNSSFQGKIDVGWNYSRISYIRNMWTTHARTLAQRLGKPLPQSAVQITGLEDNAGARKGDRGEQEKITAVVNVPQSKYQYVALQPPTIETPQLRDMGEATPPLEWIGLHRDRLPNLTHQIVIVPLLRIAKDIDDAYSRILGSS